MVTPVLGTPRLVLRPYVGADRAFAVSFFGLKEVFRHSSTGALSREEADALFDRIFGIYRDGRFCVWLVEEAGKAVGHAELKPRAGEEGLELVYFLAPQAQGRGLGSELVGVLTAHGLSLVRRLIATVHPDNVRSARVLERHGFRLYRRTSGDDGETLWFSRP